MVNPTYKHLEDRFRLGVLTLGQWLQLSGCVVLALLFGIYLSPFSDQLTISISILVAGSPFAASYAAMGTEFSLGELMRAAVQFRRHRGLFAPGGGDPAARPGYLVERDDDPDTSVQPPSDPTPTGAPLWDY